jgi:formate dehydrogenase subunit delta
MDDNKLVTMLNQIAGFYRRLPAAEAAFEIAEHVEKFWEPRMRQAIYAHMDAGGAGLVANAAAGIVLMRGREAAKPTFVPHESAA